MFKSRNFMYALFGVVGLVFLTSIITTIKVQSQQEQSNKLKIKVTKKGSPTGNEANTQPTEKEIDDAATPVVDFDNPNNPNESDPNLRHLKNTRYDRHHFVQSEINPRTGEVVSESQSHNNISDIPVEISDLVVEGVVTDSKAFLSNDKTGVYSEFTIQVSKIVKASHHIPVNEGDTIITERNGGRVRYPSGKIVRYREEGQGSPLQGKKYLFFLAKTPHANYTILTGYELRGNKISALDGSRTNRLGRGDWSFDKHNGKERDKFSEEVQKALTSNHGKEVNP